MFVNLVILNEIIDRLNAVKLSVSFLFLLHGSFVQREGYHNRLVKFADSVLVDLTHFFSTEGLRGACDDHFNHATHEPELKLVPHMFGVVHCFLSTLS